MNKTFTNAGFNWTDELIVHAPGWGNGFMVECLPVFELLSRYITRHHKTQQDKTRQDKTRMRMTEIEEVTCMTVTTTETYLNVYSFKNALFFLVGMFVVIITNQTLKFKGWLSQTKENDIYYSYQKIMQMEKLKIQVRCSLVNASKVIKESKNTCTHNVIEEKWGFLTGKRKKSSGTRTKTLTGPFLTYRCN